MDGKSLDSLAAITKGFLSFQDLGLLDVCKQHGIEWSVALQYGPTTANGPSLPYFFQMRVTPRML